MKTHFTIEELSLEVKEKERKLRYWMQVCELEDKRIPGQTAYYSQDTLDRLRFIKMVLDMNYQPEKGTFKPTLSEIKNVLEIIGLEQLRDVLSGKEPFEVGYLSKDKSGEPSIRTLGGEYLPLDSKKYGTVLKSRSIAMSAVEERGSALDYISQVMSKPPSFKRKQDWQTLKLGTDLELRYRTRLTSRQEQQIKLAGKLIQSIMNKEK